MRGKFLIKKIDNQDKYFYKYRTKFYKKEKKVFKFAVPMVRRDIKNHLYDCYFCRTNGLILIPNLTFCLLTFYHPVPNLI